MKSRPSGWWFLVGGVVMLVGLVLGVVLVLDSLSRVTHTDATFLADGSAHTFSAPAGKQRMAFAPEEATVPDCEFADGAGDRIGARAVFGTSTVTTGGQTWTAFATLDGSPDGSVTATCASADSAPVRVGAPITVSGLGSGVVLAFVAFVGVGGLGFVILVVTTVLWISRRPAEL